MLLNVSTWDTKIEILPNYYLQNAEVNSINSVIDYSMFWFVIIQIFI